MNKAIIENSILSGSVTMPPSKSAAHRALICSFLSGGGSVSPLISSNDMKATLGVIEALKADKQVLNCIESGSTLRFMIPVAAALGKSVKFIGEGRLPERPIGEYVQLLGAHGVSLKTSGGLPLEISGQLESGVFEIRGDVSSQYITGLLLALPILNGDSQIRLTTALQSKPYVDMTLKVMADYGVHIEETHYGYFIRGNQKFLEREYIVEGDWSQAAFFMSAGAIGGEIEINGLDFSSAQGDKAVADVMKSFGADVQIDKNKIICRQGRLRGIEIDCEDIPDMVPAIAVTAAFAQGKTVIKGAGRLRLKESDRLEAICKNLKRMGADVSETADGMVINGGKALYGAELSGYNDHRIVMAFSVAALFAKGETVITHAQSINKSYPSFFEEYKRLGGRVNVISARE